MGVQPVNPPEFRAYAQTLNPTPLPETPPAVLVKTETVTVTPEPVASPVTVKTPDSAPINGGSEGYVAGGSNCVAFVCQMSPGLCQNGNAGTWRSNSSVPSVGAVMIFRPGQQGASGAGHVGLVTGLNADGSVNLAHANWPGQTRFASTGNFYR